MKGGTKFDTGVSILYEFAGEELIEFGVRQR
jgi:hypothetical protein